MIQLSISHATDIYSNASLCEIIRHTVDHPVLPELSRAIRSLVHSLGDDIADEYWRQTLGPIRRLGFAFCSTPLPFSQTAAFARIDWDRLRRQVRLCEQLFPDSHDALATLLQQLEALCKEDASPFITPLELLHEQSGGLSVVLRNARMNQPVAAYFAQSATLRKATVVSATQLRGPHMCKLLVAIGPCGWFPEYVFSAPRSAAIHVISPRWIRDAWKPGPVFLHNSKPVDVDHPNHRIGSMPKVEVQSEPAEHPRSEIHPADLLSPSPILGSNGLPSSYRQPSDNEDTVPARLCHLSSDRAVFVAADDSASSLIVDTTEIGHATVRRTPVGELEPGQYLLLRTSGSGDFIASVADGVLGDSATERRSQQAEWKNRLMSKAIERFGDLGRRELSAKVTLELHSKNLSEARAESVHYWMSSKCIRPRKIEDFTAILKFAELQDRSEELWSAMGDIDRAHRRAGHLIRRMLLNKITTASLELLERDGEMDFELSDQDGGTLSAFQILAIAEDDFEVPNDLIGTLMEMEE